MKHLVIVTTSYPCSQDGSEAAGSFVADFAVELSKLARVTVIAPAQNATSIKANDRLQTIYFHTPKQPLSLLKPLNPTDWPAIAQILKNGHSALGSLAESDPIDHILALWTLPSGHWARSVGIKYNIPYSIWALGSDIWSLGQIPLIRYYLAWVLKHATKRFADGYQLAADVERICGCPCTFMPSSRNFGHPKRSVNAGPPYRLAFLGRWHTNKGIDLLLEALAQLDDDDWEKVELIRIHGGGPLGDQVHRGVESLRHAKRPVELGSYLDLAAARDLFDWTDFVLIPSRIESIPVVFSDAMQSIRPVIATPVGDLPRLIENGTNGWISTATSATDFAHTLHKALTFTARMVPHLLKYPTFTPQAAAIQFYTSLQVQDDTLHF